MGVYCIFVCIALPTALRHQRDRHQAEKGNDIKALRQLLRRDGMGWDGMGWDGMGWDGMGWDGMGWDGMGWDGMGWDGRHFGGLNAT